MVTWLHCLWACGKAEHHGRENVHGGTKLLHGARKQREEERARKPIYPPRTHPKFLQ
jgi:hypothetical protein